MVQTIIIFLINNMNKSDSNDTLEEVYLSNSSLLSESINLSDDALNDKTITIDGPNNTATVHVPTTKRKNRLVTAFRSFRKKKTEIKPSEEPTRNTEIIEDFSESQRKSTKSDKKRSRTSRLVKRLSMSGIRRSKVKSLDSLKRETPEGAILSVSEISLIEIGVDENISAVQSASKVPRRGDQLQITISGKKIERRKDDAIVKPISDTKITETEPSKPQRKSKKFNITVSDQDTSPTVPAPPIPYSICGSDISSVSSISTVEKISHTHSIEQSSICSTGVIKKSSFRKQNKRPLAMSVSKTGSLERGRRYPRPADELKTDKIDLTTATKLDGSSGSGTTDHPTGTTSPPTKPSQSDGINTDDKPKIEFEVGTKVRPMSTTPNLNRIDKTTMTYSGRDELGSLDTSSNESKTDTARRRIAYVAAPSISFSEDEPADSLLSIREPLSHLSGISEYNSLDSDFSLPPLFGDVIDDDGTNMASTPEKHEHLYKILVIGELGTGKTSFIKRYVHQFFSQNYRATIGVDFALKVLNWDNNTIIRLQLWDIAGQERFGNMTRVYYKEAVGAFIVFDVTRSATFDAVVKWKQDLDSKVQLPNGSPIPCILLANKCDQQKQGIAATPDKMNEYVKEHGFAGWFETSAKENVHIEEAARALVNKILLNDKLISTNDIGDPDKFGLDSSGHTPKKNCSC